MSPTMWILILSGVVVGVDAEAHSADCTAALMAMGTLQTADGVLCFPEGSRRLSDVATSPWRRLDGHGNMCLPECLEAVNTVVGKCETVEGMAETVGSMKMTSGMCSDKCMVSMMGLNGVEKADGTKCFPGSRRLSDGATSPWRRLDEHAAVVQNLCETNCKAAVKTMMDECKNSEMGKETVDMMKGMMPMCDGDKCLENYMKMTSSGKCDTGDDMAKVCGFTGYCKTYTCGIKAECKKDKPIMGLEAAQWEAGFTKMTTTMDGCPSLCAAVHGTTSSGIRMTLSGLAGALLFAVFAVH